MSKRKAVSQDNDKRAYHNALEKQRRDDINIYFTEMKNCVPEFQNPGKQVTKKKVLSGVANYILRMEKSNAALRGEVQSLLKDNKLKFEQINKLERAKKSGDRRKLKELLETINDEEEEADEYSNQNLITVGNSDTESESSSSVSETEDLEGNTDDDEVPRNYNQILFNVCQGGFR